MTDYPIALAIEDFAPVAPTVTGVAFLIPYARTSLAPGTSRLIAAAAMVIGAAGSAKATWKLIVALDGPDIRWMYHLLFPLLAIGFTLLAYALLGRGHAFLGALLAAALCASAIIGDTWPAMAWAIAAVTISALRLVHLARSSGDLAAAWLFGLWLAGQYVLGPLAARPDQSVTLQWFEQSCNTLTQLALAYASWRLYKASSPTREVVTT